MLLHVVTEKGHGFQPAAEDPTSFHAPAPFERDNGEVVSLKTSRGKSYTEVVRDAILEQMRADPRVVVITAAMCQGNMLEPVRDEFPERFFDVGICESHAVAFAAGLAKAGLRPMVDIYSTFLQRSYDQIFQEVALQNLPVTLLLDRAGIVGPDGPTHHGVFDLTYLRPLPNLVVMAPGDEADAAADAPLRLGTRRPGRHPLPEGRGRNASGRAQHPPVPNRDPNCGRTAESRCATGDDGMLIACGTLVADCLRAAEQLAGEGLGTGRDQRPLRQAAGYGDDRPRGPRASPFAVTVEEGALMGGFGSAVLEAASDAGVDTSRRPPPGHARPLRRTRRPRRIAARPGAGRGRHRRCLSPDGRRRRCWPRSILPVQYGPNPIKPRPLVADDSAAMNTNVTVPRPTVAAYAERFVPNVLRRYAAKIRVPRSCRC